MILVLRDEPRLGKDVNSSLCQIGSKVDILWQAWPVLLFQVEKVLLHMHTLPAASTFPALDPFGKDDIS